MLNSLKHAVDWVFGQTNGQKVSRLRNYAEEVNALGEKYASRSEEELREETARFRERIERGEELESILPEAFAVVREVAERKTDMRPYDVQIIGAAALHQRRIAEMQTGEGKTLVATMPAYLNALQGQVHIATVNDYLARRDRNWMGPIYETLGLEVGLLQEDMETEERKRAYRADIVYGTAAQFGFDYLRDNMVASAQERVGAERHFAIVDEIDSILIDEARTPLIISGSAEQSTKLYRKFAGIAPRFKEDKHFEVDEKNQQLTLTDEGANKAESFLHVDDIYAPENLDSLHHLKLALRARTFFQKDEDYIVKDGRVVIVDEFTGRLMPDRRYSDGLHQALEAKEGMLVRKESQTFAQITLQNFFLLYDGLSGMTGTAKTEEDEFEEIYGLDVVVVPTNEPLQRDNQPDKIFKTKEAKYQAIADEVERLHGEGRPVLVGTNAIEKSERLSKILKERGLKHEVLNAKQHAREAEIVKKAGQRGAITIATNMAGRGTDIKLGQGVAELGGLHVIGAQRHESRRIDNQLLGRAGRQGDPGSSQFYLSMEDDLIRIFGGDRIGSLMEKAGMEEGQAIENNLLTNAIRRAQQKVEGINFERRKQVLKYDEVMASQRKAIYRLRDHFLLEGEEEGIGDEDQLARKWEEIDRYLKEIIERYAEDLLEEYCPQDLRSSQWSLEGLGEELKKFENASFSGLQEEEKREHLGNEVEEFVLRNWERQKERLKELDGFRPQDMKALIMKMIDKSWRRHLFLIDDLKEGIGWTSYGGQDPLVEFKRESFDLFQDTLAMIRENIVELAVQRRVRRRSAQAVERERLRGSQLSYSHENVNSLRERAGEESTEGKANNPQQRIVEEEPGRNDPCPCGSGKKYKYCCGSNK